MRRAIEAVFIGTSAGGIDALIRLFESLEDRLEKPVIVVQHMKADTEMDLKVVFGRSTRLSLLEVGDKMKIENRHIYFAPPGYHLLIERDRTFALSQDELVHYSRPSIDVCFESAAQVYGAGACGLLLTGANADGAMGLKYIHQAGGVTMVQDPAQAQATAMPEAALALFRPDFVGSLSDLAQKVLVLQKGDSRE